MNATQDPAGSRLAPTPGAADLLNFICGQMVIEPADGPDTKFSFRLSDLDELRRHLDIHYVILPANAPTHEP